MQTAIMGSLSRILGFVSFSVVLFAVAQGFPADTVTTCRFQVDPLVKGSVPIISSEHEVISPKYNPDDRTWWIEIPANNGKEYTFLCPGQNHQLNYFAKSILAGRCDANGQIQTEYGNVLADELRCSSVQAETVTRAGKCFNDQFTKIHIAFPGTSTPFIEVCHDEKRSDTLYTKHTINGPKLGEGVSINHPSFKEAEFYPYIDAESCYKQAEQIDTIAEIVGSQSLANQYVVPSKNLFLSRGHLTPNGDGIPADEKKATFYFVNADPQWQTINGGNWNQLEIKTRTYAETKKALLTVWTGAFGVTTLKDSKGVDKEIYLGKNSTGLLNVLPIPSVLFKVIVDESAKTGIVVLQINNPYAENHKPADFICPDICSQIPWVSWQVGNAQLGTTYCCDVSSFAKAKPGILPDLGNLSLLK